MNENILNRYKTMTNFIANMIGDNCEVILHDVTKPNNSIIAIANGHLSGRKLNGPMTDLALRLQREKIFQHKDFLTNYKSVSKGNKIFRSSVYFIKNDELKLIGMLCINIEVSSLLNARDFLNNFLGIESESNSTEDNINQVSKKSIIENLDLNAGEILTSLINEEFKNINIPSNRMSPEEKIAIVNNLDKKGVFLLKGGVSETAKVLETSEPTIYRYLNKIKSGQ